MTMTMMASVEALIKLSLVESRIVSNSMCHTKCVCVCVCRESEEEWEWMEESKNRPFDWVGNVFPLWNLALFLLKPKCVRRIEEREKENIDERKLAQSIWCMPMVSLVFGANGNDDDDGKLMNRCRLPVWLLLLLLPIVSQMILHLFTFNIIHFHIYINHVHFH